MSTVTLISVDRDFTTVFVDSGKVIKSGLLSYGTCRTQIMIDFGFPTENIPRYAPSNHHVMILGDFVDEIKDISYMLNMDAITYREIAYV